MLVVDDRYTLLYRGQREFVPGNSTIVRDGDVKNVRKAKEVGARVNKQYSLSATTVPYKYVPHNSVRLHALAFTGKQDKLGPIKINDTPWLHGHCAG